MEQYQVMMVDRFGRVLEDYGYHSVDELNAICDQAQADYPNGELSIDEVQL